MGWVADDHEENSSDSDQDLDPNQLVSILIIGKSGSGKTYLTKSLVEQFKQPGQPTYALNDNTRNATHKKIGWDKVLSLTDCALVVEDIISAKRAEFEILQQLLCVRSHHDRVNPVIAISHHLMRNNIHGLLAYFNFIYVAAVKSNIASFRYLLKYYAFEEDEIRQHIRRFKAANEQFTFFMFDIERQSIRLTRAEESVRRHDMDSKLLAMRKKMEAPLRLRDTAFASAKKYLTRMRRNSDYALILFELIYPYLPVERLDANHLTVTLSKEGREVKVSVIDYIGALLDETQGEPDYYVYQFHRYLRRKKNLHLPKTYVLNKIFWT